MEKPTLVRNGVISRLPPGFRFHPTDEELVVQYLKRKAFACPLPASIIHEVNVCKYDPWDLPAGDWEKEKYFFSNREVKYLNGNRCNRATGSGYWKATGIDKQIVASRSNQAVGMKKTLVFYRGKPTKGSKTDWIMHEYRLMGACPQTKNSTQNSTVHTEDWVLCRVFLKKRVAKNENEDAQQCTDNKVKPRFINFMMQDNTDKCPSSSSSASSGITEVRSVGSDHEESSSCNSVSSSNCRREPHNFFT